MTGIPSRAVFTACFACMAVDTQPLQIIERPDRAAFARRNDVIHFGAGFVTTLSTQQVTLQHNPAQRPPSGGIVNAKRIVTSRSVVLPGSDIAAVLRAVTEIRTSEVTAGPRWYIGHPYHRARRKTKLHDVGILVVVLLLTND